MKLNVKPLSVNRAWQGRRFKTDDYKAYEEECLLLLPRSPSMNTRNPTSLSLRFGLSNPLSDFDNCVKPFVDILQKKYGFNDRSIMRATIEKVHVKKGQEFVEFELA